MPSVRVLFSEVPEEADWAAALASDFPVGVGVEGPSAARIALADAYARRTVEIETSLETRHERRIT
jgi:hypothetical protein